MLIISNEDGCGVNVLFPALLPNQKKAISVSEWAKYKKFVWFFVLANLAFCLWFAKIIFAGTPEEIETLYSSTVPLFFLYAFVKIKVCQRRVRISVAKGMKTTVAPAAVWLDHFLFGVAGVLLQNASMKMEPDLSFHYVLIFLQVAFSIYAVLPLVNYLKFKTDVGRTR